MSMDWKELKKKALQLLHHPKTKWVFLGCGAALLIVAIVMAIVAIVESNKPPITQGNTSTITLVAGGDLNITENTVASGGEAYDYTAAFLDVAQIFAQADGAMLNLEGNFCGAPYGDSYSAPQELAQHLAKMGVDFLQTANSCTIQNGLTGLKQTINSIRSAGMEPLGSYADAKDSSQRFVLRSINGVKVAFVAFTKGMDGMALPSGSEKCVNLLYTDYTSTYKKIDTDGITGILQAVQDAKPDITIALLHWGSEENTSVSSTQKKIAQLMLQNGVDAIIGTHSHQVQSINFDADNGTLVAYSLGDFYGNGTNAGNQYSILLHLQITKNWDTGEAAITGWDYTPIYTLTQNREKEDMRILQIRPALEAYENDSLSKVSETAYNNMKSALAQIEKKIQPLQT